MYNALLSQGDCSNLVCTSPVNLNLFEQLCSQIPLSHSASGFPNLLNVTSWRNLGQIGFKKSVVQL